MLVGCASAPKPPVHPEYEEAASSALAFDLPADRGVMHPELARAGREQAAFLGFDLPGVESYTTATDTLSTDQGDFHIQESVSVKSGTRYH